MSPTSVSRLSGAGKAGHEQARHLRPPRAHGPGTSRKPFMAGRHETSVRTRPATGPAWAVAFRRRRRRPLLPALGSQDAGGKAPDLIVVVDQEHPGRVRFDRDRVRSLRVADAGNDTLATVPTPGSLVSVQMLPPERSRMLATVASPSPRPTAALRGEERLLATARVSASMPSPSSVTRRRPRSHRCVPPTSPPRRRCDRPEAWHLPTVQHQIEQHLLQLPGIDPDSGGSGTAVLDGDGVTGEAAKHRTSATHRAAGSMVSGCST